MKATGFEYRHQTLLHLLVVGLAFLMYAVQRDDIVWACIKHHTIYRTVLERLVFGIGTLLIMGSAAFQTWANAYAAPGAANPASVRCDGPYRHVQYPIYFGRILFALGIGLLAPALGTVILLLGETLLVVRLFSRENAVTDIPEQYRARVPRFIPSFHPQLPARGFTANWSQALRKEASKWGLAVTMIIFTLTLRDRLAESLAVISLLLWSVLNGLDLLRPKRSSENA